MTNPNMLMFRHLQFLAVSENIFVSAISAALQQEACQDLPECLQTNLVFTVSVG